MAAGIAIPVWLGWSLLSATFAALTAILAKVGLKGIDSDVATLIRTVVIVLFLGLMLIANGKLRSVPVMSAGNWLLLILRARATGASCPCYFRALEVGDAARVAPIDKEPRSRRRCENYRSKSRA